MHLALRLARHLTALLSIVLMLGVVVASAQAKTAHTGILLSAATMPCHHALDSNGAAPTSALDLCRDLCLTQAPDTLLAPAAGISTAPSVLTVLLPAAPYVFAAEAPPRPVLYVLPAHAPPRPAPYPASAKLLI